jgi:hypothetical protein
MNAEQIEAARLLVEFAREATSYNDAPYAPRRVWDLIDATMTLENYLDN